MSSMWNSNRSRHGARGCSPPPSQMAASLTAANRPQALTTSTHITAGTGSGGSTGCCTTAMAAPTEQAHTSRTYPTHAPCSPHTHHCRHSLWHLCLLTHCNSCTFWARAQLHCLHSVGLFTDITAASTSCSAANIAPSPQTREA